MSTLSKAVTCKGCMQNFHWVCARGKEDFVCANCAHITDDEVGCCVCFNAIGYCEVFYWGEKTYRAHLLCVYFSKNFLLKTIQTLEFIPIEIPPMTEQEEMCEICDKFIYRGCSLFKCDCSYKASHILHFICDC